MPLRYIDLMSEITSSLPPLPIAEMGPPVLTRLSKPLREARVMIVTSAGVHLRQDPRFSSPNDMSFRLLPAEVPPSLLAPSHPTPVRDPAQHDINVVYPYQRLLELAAEGFIGSVTAYHLSMLGAIKKLRELVQEMAPRMAVEAKRQGADVVLHIPL